MVAYNRQHIIPQFYLKRFTISPSKKKIWIFDKINSKVFLTNVTKAGCERNFYDIPFELYPQLKGKKNPEEILFSPFDERSSKMLNALFDDLSSGCEISNEKYKFSLAYFISMLILRVKKIRNSFETLSKKLQEIDFLKRGKIREKYGNKEHELLSRAAHFEDLKNPAIIIDPMANELLGRFEWNLCVNATEKLFYTSDNPVVVNADCREDFIDNIRLDRPGRCVYIPLSPKYILVLKDRKIYVPLSPGKIILEENGLKEVLYFNTLQVAQSSRWIYSSTNDFELVCNLLKKHPKIINR